MASIAADIDASVTVSEICGVSLDTDSITFTYDDGNLVPEQTSDTERVVVTNSGNTNECDYYISGTDWSYGLLTVSDTEYCIGDVCTPSTPLTSSSTYYLTLDDGESSNTDFEVTIPADTLPGTYSQTIEITLQTT